MLGGSGNAATPYAGAVHIAYGVGGSIDVQIGGSLSVTSGSTSSAPAVIGSIDDTANVSISSNGNITLTADVGKVAIGSMAPGYGANVSLVSGGSMMLGDNTGNSTGKILVGSLSDSSSATQIDVWARNDITIGNPGGAGVLIGVATPAGNKGSSINIQAGAIKDGLGNPVIYGGNLVLKASAGIDSGDGGVTLRAAQTAPANGAITLAGGSRVSGGLVTIEAGGDIDTAASIHAGAMSNITVAAGWDPLGNVASP